MASIEERLQIKREPLDKWSIREQLCLAVARISDQNLTSVSRALKPFGESNRPADWFHQKNCAAQYGALLANVETPKRKKRTSSTEVIMETPAEVVLRNLLNERRGELKKLLHEEKTEYAKLQRDLTLLQSGNVSEEQLDLWCKEMDEEEHKKEQEQQAHDQWLREREQRKLEIERVWRPVKPSPIIGQKRKHSESIDSLMDETMDEPKPQESPRPALSPLLTSLLKSPSQVPHVATSSILHSAITNQKPTNTNTNPMIASLLNSSTVLSVSPGLQQLVSSAIAQEPIIKEEPEHTPQSTNDILDDPSLQILKIDDLANSILIQNGPLPEIKTDVDDIISDLIENAQELVADPEQHLQLDGNGDILELDDFEDPEPDVKEEEVKPVEKPLPEVDPFEFQEEEAFEPTKLSVTPTKTVEVPKLIENQEPETTEEVLEPQVQESESPSTDKTDETSNEELANIEELIKAPEPSVEPPEIIKEEEVKEVKKNEPIEEEIKVDKVEEVKVEEEPKVEVKPKSESPIYQGSPTTSEKAKELEELLEEPFKEEKKEVEAIVEDTTEPSTSFSDEIYDDIAMEVKVDKSGKMKRDYSRTKKKDEKDFDMLLTIDRVNRDDSELAEETFSERDYTELDTKKDIKLKIKSENERSNSPWTEEDDSAVTRMRRRLSTPATTVDSIPNSPVSSIFFYDDDKEYRNWKKSVLLVYSRLAAHKYASLFSKPITDEQAPGYHSIVHRPIDLLTIRRNIESGAIKTTQEFQRDVLLMFNNAIMYNKTNDTVFNMARQMQQESVQQIQILVQAQSQEDTPARRETRTSEPGVKRKRGNEENSRSKKRKED